MYDRWNDAKRTSSPLVFDLNGDGVVETLSRDTHNIYFDHAGDGFAELFAGRAQNAPSQTAGQSAPARAGHAPKRRSCHGGSCARPRAIDGAGRQRQPQKKAWRQLFHHQCQPRPAPLAPALGTCRAANYSPFSSFGSREKTQAGAQPIQTMPMPKPHGATSTPPTASC